jgi:AraC family transcriptional regulator
LTAGLPAHYAFSVSSNVEPFRVRTLRETPNVSLSLFDHPHGAQLPTEFSAHEAVEHYQINVVESGFFRLRLGRSVWTLGAGSIFLARPTDEYRYSHVKHVQHDTCLRVDFFGEMANQLADVFDPLSLVLPGTNRLGWLAIQLAAVAADDPELALESVATEMLEAASTTSGASRHLYRADQLKWYGRRIGAARELMDADPAAHHSLWRLSSEVSMSPFQFARVFRELVGIPPHQYLIRLRLSRARDLLQSGMAVTDVCYAVGFNNLSHFVRSFHRAFGVAPSRLKKSAATGVPSMDRRGPRAIA